MNTANTCANCHHARRPLPSDWTSLDFFDRPVVAQEAVFRTTCTAVVDAEKPCLKPAPVAPSISTDIEAELFELRNIIGLAAFACEARRVLAAVDQVTAIHPSTGEVLNQMISARSNWHEMGNYAADVLNDARERLDTLLGDTP